MCNLDSVHWFEAPQQVCFFWPAAESQASKKSLDYPRPGRGRTTSPLPIPDTLEDVDIRAATTLMSAIILSGNAFLAAENVQ